VKLSIIGYDHAGAWIKEAETVEEALAVRSDRGDRAGRAVTWINIDGIADKAAAQDSVALLTTAYGVHPLTLEDILDTEQRPKAEEFDDYLFITFKALNRRRRDEEGRPVFEQISLVLTADTVLTFQEIPGDSFEGIRRRILNNAGRIRRMGADYLAYVIMDAVVDDYFLILDSLGLDMGEFEDRAADIQDASFVQDLQSMKRNLLDTRRVIWPLRESLSLLLKTDSPLLSDEIKPFFKDVYDAVIQSAETIETYREQMAGVMEIRLSMMSNSTNAIMKVLTIISTIFIPLTFIVGVYGMNFRFMPELELRYAYPVTIGVMIVIAGLMLLAFKRRDWI